MTTVLLVEDDADARASLARTIRRAGDACIEAADAPAAIQAFGENAIDLAVVDLVLGDDEDGGLKVLAALRERRGAVPAIVITAFADVDRLKRALNLGASYLVEKPFRAPELLEAIRAHLDDARDLRGRVDRALGRAGLTQREADVAELVLKGLPSAEIAEILGSSDKTVRQHITRIYEKCGVGSRPELFHYVFPF